MITADPISASVTPNRSTARPITRLPSAKPIMVKVYGSEASARATPNSACTAGMITMIDHIPTLPRTAMARVMPSLVQE
jgi:hypothetical protein